MPDIPLTFENDYSQPFLKGFLKGKQKYANGMLLKMYVIDLVTPF